LSFDVCNSYTPPKRKQLVIIRGDHVMSAAETVAQPNVAAPSNVQAPRPPKVNETNLNASYANFCRVTGTPEELIVDFGLNAQPIGFGDEPIEVTQRIVLNFFTAKRLMQALGASIARHESVFGELETNVLKRAGQKS
jgi:hypothetical protein